MSLRNESLVLPLWQTPWRPCPGFGLMSVDMAYVAMRHATSLHNFQFKLAEEEMLD
jgi:hypothetical protein